MALTNAVKGANADIAKPMKGLGAGVFEVALKYRTDSYRTVYAVQIDEKIWTSKLGRSYDIYHPLVKKWNTINLDGVKIDLSHYGNLAKLLKRKI